MSKIVQMRQHTEAGVVDWNHPAAFASINVNEKGHKSCFNSCKTTTTTMVSSEVVSFEAKLKFIHEHVRARAYNNCLPKVTPFDPNRLD